MTRGGAKTGTATNERRCIATGSIRSKSDLIRFVVSPDNVIVPDLLGKLPGRGIWVSARRSALEKAVGKRLFNRAAKAQVTVPGDLVQVVETGLAARVSELIALSRKSGRAVAGYEKVKDWIARGDAAVLIQASDGSARGKTKLRPPGGPESYIGCLTANELGLAFGRENVIHGALAGGALSARVVEEATKLAGLREKDDGKARRKGTKTNER